MKFRAYSSTIVVSSENYRFIRIGSLPGTVVDALEHRTEAVKERVRCAGEVVGPHLS